MFSRNKLHLTILFALFFSVKLFGQDSLVKKRLNYNTGVTASYLNQSLEFLSLGGIIGQNYGLKKMETAGMGLCLDLSVNNNIQIIAPRMFVEGNTHGIGFRLNIINYMRNNENDLRFLPELNFTYLGLINLSCGFSTSLLKTKFTEISLYRIALTFNFIKSK